MWRSSGRYHRVCAIAQYLTAADLVSGFTEKGRIAGERPARIPVFVRKQGATSAGWR